MKRPMMWMVAWLVGAGAAWGATTEGKTGLLPLGSPMPQFSLPDVVSGNTVSSQSLQGHAAVLVAFMCRHCPYAQHVKAALAQVARDYAGKDVAVVAISANDPNAYALDAPDSLKELAAEAGFTFPLLFDESQETAKAFTAVTTPDMFIFDRHGALAYRGQFDDSRPKSGTDATGADVRQALDALLSGAPAPAKQQPAFGCGITWKPGHAPAYAR